MLNESVLYKHGQLYIDEVQVKDVVAQTGTPTYIYSAARILQNYTALCDAFEPLAPHIHYSAKANANLAILQMLVDAGAGIDAVSGGEIHRALAAGAAPENIVFAGVGKTHTELRDAIRWGVGWFNVENRVECDMLNTLAAQQSKSVRVALRYNPDVQANTHPHIATGHKGAKFGLNKDDLLAILNNQSRYPNLDIVGIHIHIGSQLGDTTATVSAIRETLLILEHYPEIRTINIGGGFPVPYTPERVPSFQDFATAIAPLLRGYEVIIEPGRSIVADAGILVTQLLYTKAQGGITLYIVDASMTELMRPALYQAHHTILPLIETIQTRPITVVGPVCETTDVLGNAAPLPDLNPGDLMAILDVGAYGMVMSNTYNQRPRPAEVMVSQDGNSWELARRRETYEDLLQYEI